VPAHLEFALGDPHQDDQWRMQTQRLLHYRLQPRNLAQHCETDLGVIGVQLIEFVDHTGQLVGMTQ